MRIGTTDRQYCISPYKPYQGLHNGDPGTDTVCRYHITDTVCTTVVVNIAIVITCEFEGDLGAHDVTMTMSLS